MRSVTQNWDGSSTVVALEGDNLITGTVQDCTPFAEHTKALHREGFHGSKELKHAASFPQVLVEKYMHINNIEFSEFMQNPAHARAMMCDPALKDFRVWPGRI